ncbi:hypothetical protein THASP1DRAFT_24938 [Thamnocephalis sphaerospora]|uniref:Uncharacterized protein n=1 Tax=Thamnocephalis sphaerospora TaxID=78915 RepID=A0A4V1IW98_9FUNG|nr:hypothetical protein THASP1DRAFT_24938 [Thamnocephalis sphaerospora]|eukprot:RKP06809.1 hypothetical protein THASP1DRAFT_24938 [Thamnocephalis sphaerospora]
MPEATTYQLNSPPMTADTVVKTCRRRHRQRCAADSPDSDGEEGVCRLARLARLAIVYPAGSLRARVLAKALARGARRVHGVHVRLLLGAGGKAGPRLPLVVARYTGQGASDDCGCSGSSGCAADAANASDSARTPSCRTSRQRKRRSKDGAHFAPPVTTQQELSNADGVLFGMYGVAPEVDTRVRAFSELLGALWHEDALRGKLTGAYFADRCATPATANEDDAARKSSTLPVPLLPSIKKRLSQRQAKTPFPAETTGDVADQEETAAFTLLTYWSEEYAKVNSPQGAADDTAEAAASLATSAIDSVEAAAELRGERFARQLLRCKVAIDAQQADGESYGDYQHQAYPAHRTRACARSNTVTGASSSDIEARRVARRQLLDDEPALLARRNTLRTSLEHARHIHSAPVSRRTSRNYSVRFSSDTKSTDNDSSDDSVVLSHDRRARALTLDSSAGPRASPRHRALHNAVSAYDDKDIDSCTRKGDVSRHYGTSYGSPRSVAAMRLPSNESASSSSSTSSTQEFATPKSPKRIFHNVRRFIRVMARTTMD